MEHERPLAAVALVTSRQGEGDEPGSSWCSLLAEEGSRMLGGKRETVKAVRRERKKGLRRKVLAD